MKRARSIRLQPKLLLGLVAMAAVLAAILAPSIAQLYRARMEEQYASLAFGQASVAADLIDGDRVEQYYRTGEKDAYYEEIHRYLQDAREKLGLKYFYVVVPEDEVMYYIWDAGVPGEDGVCDLGDTDAYYGGGNELMHGAFAVDAEQTILITNNEEYGYLASAYVAILNKAGTPVALASVDISMDMIDQQIRQFLGLTLCVVLAVFAFAVQPPADLFRGFWRILISDAGLITDPAVTGGAGAALLNAALVLALSTALVYGMHLPVTGLTFACLFMMAGFSLLGKNILNILPVLLGGWLYARFQGEPFSKYVYQTLFATCLSPLVSFWLVHLPGAWRFAAMLQPDKAPSARPYCPETHSVTC